MTRARQSAKRRERESVGARLRLAMAMHSEGMALMRENLRRAHPDATERELDELLERWASSRPADAPGRATPWPRRQPIAREWPLPRARPPIFRRWAPWSR